MEEEDSLYSRKHKTLSILERAQTQNTQAVTEPAAQTNGTEAEKPPQEDQAQSTEQTA